MAEMTEDSFEKQFDVSLSESELPSISESSLSIEDVVEKQQNASLSLSSISSPKKKKKNTPSNSQEKSQMQFIEDLEKTKKKINKKFSQKMSKSRESSDGLSQPTIFEENIEKERFEKSMGSLVAQFEDRRLQKQIIALTIINKEKFTLRAVRQQFHKSKPWIHLERDHKRTLCRGVSVDFIRGLERYLTVECAMQMETMKKENVTFLTKVIMECKTRLSGELCNQTLAFLKFIYDLGDVKLNPRKLLQLYKYFSELSEEMILVKYKANMKKHRPHELPISIYNKLCKAESQKEQFESTNLSELDRYWTQQHQTYLIDLYKENQSFAGIRECFRRKFPEEYHIWTYSAVQLRFQRLMRQGIKVLKQIAYHKNHKGLPTLVNIDSPLTRIISLRVPFKQIRIQLLNLLENPKDMDNVRSLIIGLNLECQRWKQRKQKEKKSKLSLQSVEQEVPVKQKNGKKTEKKV